MSKPLRLLIFVLVVAAAIWLLRQRLGELVLTRWLAAQGVSAQFRVAALSHDKAVLVDVLLGPTATPDFRADRVELRLGWNLAAPNVEGITLVRPTLRGTLGPAGLSFGKLDRFLKSDGPAAPLPDLALKLIDGRIIVATPAGTLTATGNGSGRLRAGFSGTFALERTSLQAGGCNSLVPGAAFTVQTEVAGVRVAGGGRLPAIACGERGTATDVAWRGSLSLAPRLDSYTGSMSLRTGALQAGAVSSGSTEASLSASAVTLSAPVAGQLRIAAARVRWPGGGARTARASGPYGLDRQSGDATADLAVLLGGANAALPMDRVEATATQLQGTLAAPLLAQLTDRLDAASRNFDASATVDFRRRQGVVSGAVTRAVVTAATGARIVQKGHVQLAYGAIGFDAGLDIGGGGLPLASLSGTGRWREQWPVGSFALSVPRWTAPGAAVEGLRLKAVATANSVAVTGDVGVSGKLGGTLAVEKLRAPITARLQRSGDFIFGERCLPVSWSRVSAGTTSLSAGRIVACPSRGPLLTVRRGIARGGAFTDAIALKGETSGAPFVLTVAPARIALSGSRITLAPAAVTGRLGARGGQATVAGSYDVASATGSGRVQSARLDDPGLPVRIGDAATDWRLASGVLTLGNATARIVDRTLPARFQPLQVSGVEASLARGVLTARGTIALAAGGARLVTFDARHDLAFANGAATLDTGTLLFGPDLQPFQITDNLRGIVANVRGPVSGHGQIAWTRDGLTSGGTLRIDKLALATEALGPVDGIDGTITFDDLFALTTPPGQTLRIARINPGVAVDDGVVVFRMLGPDSAAIDRMTWPYAGGRLTLAPVTLRAGDVRREFVLTVDDMDAQQFLQRFEIKNLNVTGRFDGRLPLVFADGKGRIVGGRMVARPGGGLIQYVGEVGRDEMGAAARLAFDALRRLRYRDLTLDIDGDLDGELVSRVQFAGSNEAAATLPGGPLPLKATGLPFRFGITVRAPFRALLGTAASFGDVRPLIKGAPELVQPR